MLFSPWMSTSKATRAMLLWGLALCLNSGATETAPRCARPWPRVRLPRPSQTPLKL